MLLALRSVESLLISYPAAVLKYLSWGLVWAAGMSITQAEVSGKAGEGWPGGAWFGARCGPKEGEERGQPRRPPSTCLGSQAGADEGQCEEEPPSGHKGQVLVS